MIVLQPLPNTKKSNYLNIIYIIYYLKNKKDGKGPNSVATVARSNFSKQSRLKNMLSYIVAHIDTGQQCIYLQAF